MTLKSLKSFSIPTFLLLRTYGSHPKPVKLAFTMYNSGKDVQNVKAPLMIMHGLFGAKQNFRSICRTLEPKLDRKILALDARNHGESPHTTEMSAKHMAVDVIELMDDLGYKQICALGHSLGARAMMFLALRFPTYVERAIFCDMSPLEIPRDFSEMLDIFTLMQEIETTIPQTGSVRDARDYAYETLKKFVKKKVTRDFIVQNLKKQPNGSIKWAVNVDALYQNFKKMYKFHEEIAGLRPYTGPVMFICGRRSNFVDPKSWPDIQKLFPNSEIHFLKAGHLVHFEQPKEFVKLTVEFLCT